MQREPNFPNADGWPDGQTDIRTSMTKFEVTFRKFPNTPPKKNSYEGRTFEGHLHFLLPPPQCDAYECKISQC